MKPNLAVMNQRTEPLNALDDFPTPPWATRALSIALRAISTPIRRSDKLWEPAAGRGLMSEVLKEFSDHVFASDVHRYPEYPIVTGSFVGQGPDVMPKPHAMDWVITNPPFNLGLAFALRAIREAQEGVALLMRSNWAEGSERYAELFSKHPPSLVAQFVERVPMVRGRWDPDATTATAYAWFIWARPFSASRVTRYFWIPPGQRQALTKPDDVKRFTFTPKEETDGLEAQA